MAKNLFPKDQTNNLRTATAEWKPTENELKALKAHSYIHAIDRIDQIWPLLEQKHGELRALEAPHALYPETYSYAELADKISKAASAFNSLGINRGDVVSLFAENSPRWLIVDQGLMRVGAVDAVRGASAPVSELRYILQDSSSVGLIVQSIELWKKLTLNEDQKQQLKFVLVLEGQSTDSLLAWDDFFSRGFHKLLNRSA